MKKSIFFLASICCIAPAHDIPLRLPHNGSSDNAGLGKQKAPHMTCNSFDFKRKEGAFMCNFGELCPTNEATGEGILVTKNGNSELTLCPRTDVGGSAEIIALHGKELNNKSITGFTFEIGSSHSEKVSGELHVDVVIYEKTTLPGFNAHVSKIIACKSQSFTIGSGTSVAVLPAEEISNWSADHFITICVHNHRKKLQGANNAPYTLSNIRLIAHSSTPVAKSAQKDDKGDSKKKKKKSKKRKTGTKKKK